MNLCLFMYVFLTEMIKSYRWCIYLRLRCIWFWLVCLQETMMDNALRTISYIADIGNIVVLMARRRMPRTASQDCIETTPGAPEAKKQYKMICHVFESEDVSAPCVFNLLFMCLCVYDVFKCLWLCSGERSHRWQLLQEVTVIFLSLYKRTHLVDESSNI